MITPELYAIFGKHAQAHREAKLQSQKGDGSAAPVDLPKTVGKEVKMRLVVCCQRAQAGCCCVSACFTQDTFSYIEVDLTRTFPQLAFFQVLES